MDQNGYYDSNDIWIELCDSEKRERLLSAGFELVINCDTMWELLSDENKKKVLNSGKTPVFVDLNTADFDALVDYLSQEIMFRSDSQAFIIGKLIEFYRKNKNRYKRIGKRPKIKK
jgi:hypothetical protein